jgi:hypothetical protein
MGDFPQGSVLAPGLKNLSSLNLDVGVTQLWLNGGAASRTGTAWPSANLAIFVPVVVGTPFTVMRFGVENGTVSGNLDAGIYTSEGKLIISTGSTAQSGVSQWQSIDVTDTLIPPGLYYLALALNNGTGQVARCGFTALNLRQSGVMQMASAFALPATATFATMAQAYLPSMVAVGAATL